MKKGKDMEEIKESIKELLGKVERDDDAQYSTEWQVKAVEVLNEYNFENDRYDDEIFDVDSDEWDDVVRHELKEGGARRLLYFFGQIEPADGWARLDRYGNAVAVSGSDMVEMLKDTMQEIEDEQRD